MRLLMAVVYFTDPIVSLSKLVLRPPCQLITMLVYLRSYLNTIHTTAVIAKDRDEFYVHGDNDIISGITIAYTNAYSLITSKDNTRMCKCSCPSDLGS